MLCLSSSLYISPQHYPSNMCISFSVKYVDCHCRNWWDASTDLPCFRQNCAGAKSMKIKLPGICFQCKRIMREVLTFTIVRSVVDPQRALNFRRSILPLPSNSRHRCMQMTIRWRLCGCGVTVSVSRCAHGHHFLH